MYSHEISTIFNRVILEETDRIDSGDIPPVPIKTYQWEDIRRAKKRGGYPWTYLNKEPFDKMDDKPVNGDKPLNGEPKPKKTRPKLKKTANVDEVTKKKKKIVPKKDSTEKETSVQKEKTEEKPVEAEKPIKTEEEVNEWLGSSSSPVTVTLPKKISPRKDDEAIPSDEWLAGPSEKKVSVRSDDEAIPSDEWLKESSIPETTEKLTTTETIPVDELGSSDNNVSIRLKPLKVLEDEPISMDDWLGSDSKTEEDKEVETILKSQEELKEKSKEDISNIIEDAPVVSEMLKAEQTAEDSEKLSQNAISITGESDTSNAEQYLDKEELSKASTTDVSTLQDKPESKLEVPSTSQETDKKRKFSSTSEITKSTLSLFQKMKNSKFKVPTFKVAKFKKLGLSKKTRTDSRQGSLKKDEPIVIPTVKRKPESPVYIHIPLNPTEEQIAKEKEEAEKNKAQTTVVVEKRTTIVTPGEQRKTMKAEPKPEPKLSLQSITKKFQKGKKSPPQVKKKSPKSVLKTGKKSPSPPKRTSPVTKKRNSPVEYIYIPLKPAEDEINLNKSSTDDYDKPPLTRKYIKDQEKVKENKIVTVGKPIKSTFKKKIIITPIADLKDDKKTPPIKQSPGVKRNHSFKEDVEIALKEIGEMKKVETIESPLEEIPKPVQDEISKDMTEDIDPQVKPIETVQQTENKQEDKPKENVIDSEKKSDDKPETKKKPPLSRSKSFKERVSETGKKIKESSAKLTKDVKDLSTKVKENVFSSSSLKRGTKIKDLADDDKKDDKDKTKIEEEQKEKETKAIEEVTVKSEVETENVAEIPENKVKTGDENVTVEPENKVKIQDENVTDEIDSQKEEIDSDTKAEEEVKEPEEEPKSELPPTPKKKVKKERKKKKISAENKIKVKSQQISEDLRALAFKLKSKQAKEAKKPTSKLLRKSQNPSFRSISSKTSVRSRSRSRSRSARISVCSSDKENEDESEKKPIEPVDVNKALEEASRKLQKIISKTETSPEIIEKPESKVAAFDDLWAEIENEEAEEREKLNKENKKKDKKSKRSHSPFDSLRKTKELGKKSIQKIKEVITHKDKTHTKIEVRTKEKTTTQEKGATKEIEIKTPTIIDESKIEPEKEQKEMVPPKKQEQELTDVKDEKPIMKTEEVHHYEPVSKEDEEDGLKCAVVQKEVKPLKEKAPEVPAKSNLKAKDSPKLEKKVSFRIKSQSQESENEKKIEEGKKDGERVEDKGDEDKLSTAVIDENKWLNLRFTPEVFI